MIATNFIVFVLSYCFVKFLLQRYDFFLNEISFGMLKVQNMFCKMTKSVTPYRTVSQLDTPEVTVLVKFMLNNANTIFFS